MTPVWKPALLPSYIYFDSSKEAKSVAHFCFHLFRKSCFTNGHTRKKAERQTRQSSAEWRSAGGGGRIRGGRETAYVHALHCCATSQVTRRGDSGRRRSSETETLLWPIERREDLPVDGTLSVLCAFAVSVAKTLGDNKQRSGRATGTGFLLPVYVSSKWATCVSASPWLSASVLTVHCPVIKLRMVNIREQ